jgi:lipopolysaccharide biosynthesis regulator YciM
MFTFNKFNLGYVENNMPEKALDLFEQMHLEPGDSTYTIVFNACAQLGDDRAMNIGKKLLDQMSNNFENKNNLLNSALHMLIKFGDITRAEHVFDRIKNKDSISYSHMINGNLFFVIIYVNF